MRAPWKHPQATHQVILGTWTVAYQLARSARRSLGLRVDAQGLSVRAPLRLPLAAIEATLLERADWLTRQHARVAERENQRQRVTPAWCDGAHLPWLGGTLALRLGGAGPTTWQGPDPALPSASADAVSGWLQLALPVDAPPAQVRAAVRAWWLTQARRLFTQRLDHYAAQLGVRWCSLHLSAARTRWGSARADGRISLNWRLLHAPPELIDDVVAHELAHLHEMNHSPAFWRWVQAVRPGHVQRRAALRQLTVPDWDGALDNLA